MLVVGCCSMLYCAPRLAVTNVILESRCRKAIHIESRMDLGKVTLRQGRFFSDPAPLKNNATVGSCLTAKSTC